MLTVHAGWGMRIAFVPEEFITEGASRSKRKGNAMATYVTLINFTDQGVLHVKDTANRASHYKERRQENTAPHTETKRTIAECDIYSPNMQRDALQCRLLSRLRTPARRE